MASRKKNSCEYNDCKKHTPGSELRGTDAEQHVPEDLTTDKTLAWNHHEQKQPTPSNDGAEKNTIIISTLLIRVPQLIEAVADGVPITVDDVEMVDVEVVGVVLV